MNFNTRAKMFGDTAEAQQAFVAREDVKEFLQRVRSFAGQTRAAIAQSDIPLFIQDQTVFKITARYDGKVVSTGNVVSVPKSA